MPIIEVLDPTAKAKLGEAPIAPRPASLEGQVLGIIDNSKPNADIFLARVRDLLVRKYRFRDVVAIQKRTVAAPLEEGALALLKERCTVAVNAWGD